ncbi:MAG: DUF3299 domain-containing protein [Pseudomonadota bacterium]
MTEMTRRALLAAAAALAALPAWAREAIEIGWADLVPPGEGGLAMRTLRSMGIISHGELNTPWTQQTEAQLTDAYDGKRVRLPGFIVPIEFDGTGVTAFLLVPYVGACIHVPPPPPNQLVFVTMANEPYQSSGLFEAVWVTGLFGAAAAETTLAEVGYALEADAIEPYTG